MALARCSRVLAIPEEITEHALTFCHPRDVAAFSKTCRVARDIVYGSPDQFLWRELFLLHPFDDPRKSAQLRLRPKNAPPLRIFDWKGELQGRVQAEIVARSNKKSSKRLQALETFVSIVQNSLPSDVPNSSRSLSLEWLTKVLRESRILETSSDSSEVQLRSRLRVYLALSLDDPKDDKTRARLASLRTKSRCFVYDLSNYRRGNKWGPYIDVEETDQYRIYNVNWVHVEAIINVISMNLSELPGAWIDTRPPIGLEATRAYSAADALNRNPRDWAGLEGTWRRYVCFMDYRDLFSFNVNVTHFNGPRNPAFFEDDNFQEATRLIELKLQLVPEENVDNTRSSSPFSDRSDEADLAENTETAYPILLFSGTSHGINGNEAVVTGSVKMGADGVVRWRFWSVYDGHTQWSSEGIQVGNVASAAGVVGTWTGAHHDQGDPVGPFWLWKVANNYSGHTIELPP